METIGGRIRQLRKNIGYNQTEFGRNIGLPQSVVTAWERGVRIPNERQIILISSVYNVRRAWLEEGEGEMREAVSPEEELAQFLGELMADDTPSAFRAFLSALAKTTPEQREFLADLIDATIAAYQAQKDTKKEDG